MLPPRSMAPRTSASSPPRARRPEGSGAACSLTHPSPDPAPKPGAPAEGLGLDEHGLLEFVEWQPLVRASMFRSLRSSQNRSRPPAPPGERTTSEIDPLPRTWPRSPRRPPSRRVRPGKRARRLGEKPVPVGPGWTVSRSQRRGLEVADDRRLCSSASCAGCTRVLIFARARVLTASSGLDAGDLDAGDRDRRARPDGSRDRPTRRARPSSTSASAGTRPRCRRRRSTAPGGGPRRDVAVLVMEGRERLKEHAERRSRRRRMARVFGPAKVSTSIVVCAMPRRPIVSVGTPGGRCHVPDHHGVCLEQIGMCRRDSRRAPTNLLLPSITILIPTGADPPTPGALPCGPGCSTSCPRTASEARRRARSARKAGIPLRRVPCRDNVVVAVEQNVGAPRGPGSAEDDRRGIRQMERANGLDAGALEQSTTASGPR